MFYEGINLRCMKADPKHADYSKKKKNTKFLTTQKKKKIQNFIKWLPN